MKLHLLFEPRLDNWSNPQDQSLWFRARIAS